MEFLQSILPYAVIAAMLAVLASLGLGVFGMARGGQFNARHANRFMRWRVGFQALAIALFALLLWIRSMG